MYRSPKDATIPSSALSFIPCSRMIFESLLSQLLLATPSTSATTRKAGKRKPLSSGPGPVRCDSLADFVEQLGRVGADVVDGRSVTGESVRR